MSYRTYSRVLWGAVSLAVLAPPALAGEAREVSSVLGPLPTPAELAAMQEPMRPPPRGDLPVEAQAKP